MFRFLLILFLCKIQSVARAENENVLTGLIGKLPGSFRMVAQAPDHEVQILYVQIERRDDGPVFIEYGWQLDQEKYFYPASTVKLPVALLALEKLNRLEVDGLDRDTTMLTLKKRDWQSERIMDPSSPTGMPSIAHDFRKIFLVSDNEAYNRLFEFVGSEEIRRRCDALGRKKTHIFHRLSAGRGPDRDRIGNAIRFVNEEGGLVYEQAEIIAPTNFGHGMKVEKGRAYRKGGMLVNEPMSFSELNFFPLKDQHLFLRDLFFPSENGLKLKKEDREFVRKVMGQYPRENQDFVGRQVTGKPDLYVKNFLRWQTPPIRDSLRCYNKSGRAYGCLTDNAYIVDREHHIEFFLSATIHVNANQIYNDDVYEYETIGEPFMAALGKAIYEYEFARAR
jgi:hypothetical protein